MFILLILMSSTAGYYSRPTAHFPGGKKDSSTAIIYHLEVDVNMRGIIERGKSKDLRRWENNFLLFSLVFIYIKTCFFCQKESSSMQKYIHL